VKLADDLPEKDAWADDGAQAAFDNFKTVTRDCALVRRHMTGVIRRAASNT
jgi:hypothetical protein